MNNQKKHSDNNLIYGKVPPQAVEVEQAVLGAILVERNAYDIAAGIIKPDCFYKDANKLIFAAMETLARNHKPIDAFTVIEQLKSIGELENVGGVYHISQLTKNVMSGANIDAHSRIVYEKFAGRELIRIAGELINLAYEESEDVFNLLDYGEKSIAEVGLKSTDGGMTPISKVIMQSMEKIEYWRTLDSHITGIPIGYELMDKATRGWQPGDFILIGARPSVGKTAFALNILKNAATLKREEGSIAVWSLEMKSYLLGLRMLAAESGIYLTKLQTGRLTNEELQSLYKQAADKVSSLPIFFDENPKVTVASITRKARMLKKKKGLSLIIIDYLQLLSGGEKSGNREQEVSKISRDLKNLAQELDVPIIALSQLSREMGVKNISWEYGPQISAMRESGALEQDADVIMMLWGPSEEDIAKDPSLDGKRRCRIAKQRNGFLITQEFDFKNDIQLFEAIGSTVPGLPAGNWKPVKDIAPPVKNYYETDKREDDLPF